MIDWGCKSPTGPVEGNCEPKATARRPARPTDPKDYEVILSDFHALCVVSHTTQPVRLDKGEIGFGMGEASPLLLRENLLAIGSWLVSSVERAWWVTQLLRQGDAKVFKKYSQMKLPMKREALLKLNRQANEQDKRFDTGRPNWPVLIQF